MSWSHLSYAERKTIAEKYRRGEPLEAEADRTGIRAGTLARNARSFLSDESARLTALASSLTIPPAQPETYNQALNITADSAIIISDVEIPDHDAWLLKAVGLVSIEYHIPTLIIAGDLVATDQQ